MYVSAKRANLAVVSTAAALALALVPQAGQAAPSASAGARATTNFGLIGSAYGSKVHGGAIPANSGRTALAYIGCTRKTGRTDTNSVARVNLGKGLGPLSGVDSSTRTYRRHGSVNVKSVNTIARLGKKDSLLEIRGIKAVARTWHDANGFHRAGHTRVAGVFSLGVRILPKNGVVDIPGIATVTLNDKTGATGRHGARQNVKAAKVDLALTDTSAVLGNATAKIHDGLVSGVLGGVGVAATGSALDNLVKTGKIARQPLPCQGTDGKWRTNHTAGVTVNNLVHLGAATASARGNQQDRTHGYAQTRGRVARATVGTSGSLVIKGVIGAANASKHGTKLVKTSKGTRIVSITFRGRDRAIPTPGNPVRIGNLAVLSAPRAHRTRYGIKVVALRVEVLKGTGTTVDLGVAKASFRPA